MNIIESSVFDTLTYAAVVVHIAVRIAPMITLCVAGYAVYCYYRDPIVFIDPDENMTILPKERRVAARCSFAHVLIIWCSITIILATLSGDTDSVFLDRVSHILSSVFSALRAGWSVS